MEFHKFSSYKKYLRAQRSVVLKKLQSEDPKRARCGATEEEIRLLSRHFGTKPFHQGLCHGVRFGQELDLFERYFGGRWIGTDIVKEVCDGKRTIHHDFSHPRQEWKGQFDIVYSNSLDHSMDPELTLKVWLDQLNPSGRLVVQWNPWHGRLGIRGNKADCFAATEWDYLDLLNLVGSVTNTLGMTIHHRGKDHPQYLFIVKNG